MAASSAQPCKFGFDCRRADCWFAHPQGRRIDGAGAGRAPAAAPQAFYGNAGGAAQVHIQQPPQVNSSVMKPIMAPIQGNGSNSPQAAQSDRKAGGARACKFGRTCHRKDCWFDHPEGRDTDASERSASRNSNASDASDAYLIEQMKKLGLDPDADGEDGDNVPDEEEDAGNEFFPASRDCSCCKGYVYSCEDPTCQALGQCGCQFDKKEETKAPAAPVVSDAMRDTWYPASRNCECCHGYAHGCEGKQCKQVGQCVVCMKDVKAVAPAPNASQQAVAK